MRYLQQLLPIKLICTIALFVGFSSFGLAQNLTGPTTVTPNSTHTYEYDGGLFLFGWTVVGGNAISSSTSGTIYYATIQWGAAGPGSVTFDNFGTPLETLNVTISEPGGGGGGSPNTGFGNENYVHSLIPRIETTDVTTLNNDEKIESITYFDGLGRAKQSIAIRAGGNQEDIVNHSEYDQYGRMAKEYLPFAQANNAGSLISNALSATNSFYNTIKYENTTNPFSEKDFESSPLNRVFKQAAPGYDWRMGGGHEIEMNYLANTANEVRRYTVSLSFANNTYTPTLVLSSGYYTAGELYKSVTEDENHTSGNNHTTQEFKDSEGRVILKRTYNANVAHDTYYVYDIYGNLGYVLPPKSEPQSAKPDATELSELCYQYKYDHRNRLVEKQVPGKGKEYIMYNKLDQPIMTQDANQREDNQWLFTKYDVFGRVAYTGIAIDSRERQMIQSNEIDTITDPLWVVQQTTDRNSEYSDDVTIYYDNGAYPTSAISEVLMVNYYDTYVDHNSGAPQSITLLGSSTANTTKVKGLATVSRVKVLDVSPPVQWITTTSYYDDKGRPVYIHSENDYLGTTNIVETQLDFIGKPLKSRTTHIRGNETIITINNFTYDHVGRLLAQTQCIGDQTLGNSCIGGGTGSNLPNDLSLTSTVNTVQVAGNSITVTNATLTNGAHLYIEPNANGSGGDQELIVLNTYDELGQLESKKVGGAANSAVEQSAGLQTVAYKYNVRGWLTNINDINSTDKLFTFSIGYNQGSNALYNGNISQTQWRTSNLDDALKTYDYTYDPLNRITAATDDTGNYNLSNVSYDKNGNIQTLKREGWISASPSLANNTGFGTMDDLAYSYDNGNRLMKVADAASIDQYGFKDDAVNTTADSSDDYLYDPNGNMIRDDNKGITGITYNHLNLPTQVTFASGNIKYDYAADGTKLKKTVSTTGTETLYANGYLYEGNTLQFFPHPEGYVSVENGNYEYIYEFKDHLGNTRLSYTDANNDGSITTNEIVKETNYFPFGLSHRGYNGNVSSLGNSVAKKYMFGGKEYQDELNLGWYDVSARNYDPALGRWMNLDPLAEQMRRHSPYNYAFNNPLRFIDPDGMAPNDIIIKGGDEFRQAALADLQSLTNDKLAIDTSGKVTIASKGSENCDCNLSEGTTLVADLIGSSKTVSIKETNGALKTQPADSNGNIQADGTPGTGTDSKISFNTNLEQSGVDENGNTNRPTSIGLGHELDHARDIATGVRDRSPTNPAVRDPDPAKGESRTTLSKGELKTRRFENKLRRENNLPLRLLDYKKRQ